MTQPELSRIRHEPTNPESPGLSRGERQIPANSLEKTGSAVKLSEDNLKEAKKLLLRSLIKAKRIGLKPAYYDGFIARG